MLKLQLHAAKLILAARSVLDSWIVFVHASAASQIHAAKLLQLSQLQLHAARNALALLLSLKHASAASQTLANATLKIAK
ncbi:MAG: hypothetical protein OSA89_19095 [Mariniblastus sp.]|nr:hypothetical protein [Mariniblastus sp.]